MRLALVLATAAALAPALAHAEAALRGPLGDRQLVRGHKIGVSINLNQLEAQGVTAQLLYSFGDTSLGQSAALAATGYGNRVVLLDAPTDAESIAYQVSAYDASGAQIYADSDGGQPYVRPLAARAVAVRLDHDGKLAVSYSGAVTTTYDTFLHLAWNDWSSVAETFMSRIEFSYFKAGIYYDYNTASIPIPAWASYVDFCFKDQRQGGIWDNGGGGDWHFTVHPFVEARVDGAGATYQVTVTYTGGALSPVILHYGTDGWQHVHDLAMVSTGEGGVSASFTLPTDASTLDFDFHDGGGHWDNDFGMDWHVSLAPAGGDHCGAASCP